MGPQQPDPHQPDPDTPATMDTRRRYPSDLTDEQWRRVAKIIDPGEHVSSGKQTETGPRAAAASQTEEARSSGPRTGRGRPRIVSMREVLNAMNYRWRTGCTWRMLPHDFPAWATVYAYFRQWRRNGNLAEIRALLLERETVLERIEAERVA